MTLPDKLAGQLILRVKEELGLTNSIMIPKCHIPNHKAKRINYFQPDLA
jgi:hypothetical protein